MFLGNISPLVKKERDHEKNGLKLSGNKSGKVAKEAIHTRRTCCIIYSSACACVCVCVCAAGRGYDVINTDFLDV